MDRLSYFEIRVGDTDINDVVGKSGTMFTNNNLCHDYNNKVPEVLTDDVKPYVEIMCDQPVKGRYLSIQHKDGSDITRGGEYKDILTICEVDIRGYNICADSTKSGKNCDVDECWCKNGCGTDNILGDCTDGCVAGRLGRYCMEEVVLSSPPEVSVMANNTVIVEWTMWRGVTTYKDSVRDVTLEYVVQHRESGANSAWTSVTTSPTTVNGGARQQVQVTGLDVTKTHEIRVNMEKKHGQDVNEYVTNSGSKELCAAPGLPTISTNTGCQGAENTAAYIQVTWTNSSNSHCSDSTVKYDVGYKEVGDSMWTTAQTNTTSPTKLSGLSLNTAYNAGVKPKNTYQPSFNSDYTSAGPVTTVTGVPSEVKNVNLNTRYDASLSFPNMAEITVSWEEPDYQGCKGDQMSYNVIYRQVGKPNSEMTMSPSTTTSAVLSGLVPYIEYEVKIKFTSQGRTSHTKYYRKRTAQGKSGPPQNPASPPTSQSVRVSWSAPTEPHGVISGYEVKYRRQKYVSTDCPQTPGEWVTGGNVSTQSYNIDSLYSSTVYDITISAFTDGGKIRGLTTTTTATTLSTAPGEARNVDLTSLYKSSLPFPNMAEITVKWEAPTETGCNSRPSYRVVYQQVGEINSQSTTAVSADTGAVLTRLVPYTEYEISIETTRDGMTSKTPNNTIRTAQGQSGPSENPVSTPTSQSVHVSWSAPTEPHGVISGYEVKYRRQKYVSTDCQQTPGEWVTSGNVSKQSYNINIDKLNSSTVYNINITAFTDGGKIRGLTTTTTANTLSTAPNSDQKPQKADVAKITSRNASVEFYHIPCDKRNGNFTAFRYNLTDLKYGTPTRNESADSAEVTLKDLIPFNNYSLTYGWKNRLGVSQYSDEVRLETDSESPPAPNVTADSSSDYINLLVAPPYPPHALLTAVHGLCRLQANSATTSYKTVNIHNNSKDIVTLKFTDVKSAQKYNCQAWVSSADVGTSDKSSVVEVETNEGQAGPPRDFKSTNITTSSSTLIWTTPFTRNGLIKRYKYKCAPVQTKNPSKRSSLKQTANEQSTLQHESAYNPSQQDKDYKRVITKLWSATQYNCVVWAVNGFGDGLQAAMTFWTDPEDILIPQHKKIAYIGGKSDETSVFVTLPNITSANVEIQAYRIVVERLGELSREKRSIDDQGELRDFHEANKTGSNVYIAAEWFSPTRQFVVGDGSWSNDKYYNAPLKTGENYNITYGVGSDVNGVHRFYYIGLASPVRVGYYGRDLPIWAITAAAVAILLLIIISIVVIVIVVLGRKHRLPHQQNRATKKRSDSTDVFVEMEARPATSSGIAAEAAGTPNILTVHDRQFLPYSRSHSPYGPAELETIVREMTGPPEKFTDEHSKLPNHEEFTRIVANRPENRAKNRYVDIVPYDHSRVRMKDMGDDDYINASWVEDYAGNLSYITSPGPKEALVPQFWMMIWQENVKIVVMVTDCVEATQIKCAQYWPNATGKGVTYGNVTVTTKSIGTIDGMSGKFIKRVFSIQKGNQARVINHFQYVGCPDHGAPHLCSSILTLRRVVREATPPGALTLVHCSEGIGRTGMYVTIDDVLRQYETNGGFSIVETIHRLRHYREQSIQTNLQYVHVHHALLEATMLKQTERSLPEFIRHFQLHGPSQGEYEILDVLRRLDLQKDCTRENECKNRVPDIFPGEKDMPELKTVIQGRNSYINACKLHNLSGSPPLIATQLPLEDTVVDFWRLVYDFSITIILRMDGDLGVNNPSSERYWPQTGRAEYGPFTVDMKSRENVHTAFSEEVFELHNKRVGLPPVEIFMFVYHGWPDKSDVPTTASSLLSLYTAVKDKHGDSDRNVIVQCYDGATKCGLFAAAYSLLDSIQRYGTVDVYHAARITQITRRQIIPNMAQYGCLHEIAHEYVEPIAGEDGIYEEVADVCGGEDGIYENNVHPSAREVGIYENNVSPSAGEVGIYENNVVDPSRQDKDLYVNAEQTPTGEP